MGRSEGGVVDPAARDKYRLQVTAGPSYDPSTHQEVAVNSGKAHFIENDLMSCWLNIRIKDYNGLPQESPVTSDYFKHPLHLSDRYSIGFSFCPKRDIKGSDLVTGFDFDHSIRSRVSNNTMLLLCQPLIQYRQLPPGFRYAMRIVTTLLDPGIYSDPYSDKPYLYGPALSSFFAFRIGEQTAKIPAEKQVAEHEATAKGVIEEGADGTGQQIRDDYQIPAKTSKRRKNFLDEKKLDTFTFEAGRMYQADFFNPYLDFANFALRIPGFSISVVRYIDDKTHQLRYVLKDRSTGEVLFVVIFTLLFGQKLEDTLQGKSEGEEATQAMPVENEHEDLRRHASNISSSWETPSPSSRSRSSSSSSEYEDCRETRHDRPTAASTLANSIYSGFASLGFGRTASTSTTASSVAPSPARRELRRDSALERPKTMEQKVDNMDNNQIEEYLKAKHASG